MVSFKRIAYGKPKPLKGFGPRANGLMNLGVKIRQVLYLRGAYNAYNAGRGRKR